MSNPVVYDVTEGMTVLYRTRYSSRGHKPSLAIMGSLLLPQGSRVMPTLVFESKAVKDAIYDAMELLPSSQRNDHVATREASTHHRQLNQGLRCQTISKTLSRRSSPSPSADKRSSKPSQPAPRQR